MDIKCQNLSVTALGGGTGLSTLLRGLKNYTKNISAVVTVADDGGSSGLIRQEFGILPPGDIRNCILALSNAEPLMEKLLQYRYKEGVLNGQNFGNLLIAAMTDLSNGFLQAIRNISKVLAVTGAVYPVSLDNLVLSAILEDGTVIEGESLIPQVQIIHKSPIKEVFITPADAKPLPEVIESIMNSDIVTIGPGSLYTSLVPVLLVPGVSEALRATKAKKFYISNIMTQPGETKGYTLTDHIKTILRYGGDNIIDYCIVNKQKPDNHILYRYLSDDSEPVFYDKSFKNYYRNIEIIEEDLLFIEKGLIRHNKDVLARLVLGL